LNLRSLVFCQVRLRLRQSDLKITWMDLD